MFDFNSYCFCPKIIEERFSDSEFFHLTLIPNTINSSHHVIVDINEELWAEYTRRVSDDVVAYTNLKTWRTLLNTKKNKILYSRVGSVGSVSPEFLTELTLDAPITSRKYIVTNHNDDYKKDISKLKENGVDLLSDFNISNSAEDETRVIAFKPSKFYIDLIHALSMVSCNRASKLENEHNDYLRSLLDFKGYIIKDQTRSGFSSSRKGMGSLDLQVMSNNSPVSIIESLRLASVDKNNIIEHYNKLIDNYNSLRLSNVHIVVYFNKSDRFFLSFYEKYKEYISSLSSGDFDSDVEFTSLKEVDIKDFSAMRAFEHKGQINGHSFTCSHTCISFSS
ncbi:hypothetical protein N480_21205 [Pseudoalteromonas luteoviolacea S2607]|uniref:hypothetical protein n=1 Tax=Pseudoalteromonas luteoviolacea TaxID=43657 RepID=UPI0007B05323|nr:hypothetical protein [Pseudoalteromonas luteoviolacea]KZN34545.1 hypothetical protein N480_21205 [Pseudoalteromonas luteoviolacea S2607]